MRIEESNEPVSKNIKRIIEEKGLKQIAVASKAGYGENMFSSMLKGRKLIKACDIGKISRALEVEPNELFQTVD